jgi:hypothetical protein
MWADLPTEPYSKIDSHAVGTVMMFANVGFQHLARSSSVAGMEPGNEESFRAMRKA